MLLGNNTFDWVTCSLHVSVISVLHSAVAWCLPNLSSMGTGDQDNGEDSPAQGGQLRHSEGTVLFAGLGYEGITHSPVSKVQFVHPS